MFGGSIFVALAAACAAALLGAPAAGAAIFTVDSTDDSGAGTLRQAILDANAAPGADEIEFDASLDELTIEVPSALPPVTDAVVLNGCSADPDSAGPCIGLNESAPGPVNGLAVQASNVTVRGLALTNFDQAIFYADNQTGLNVQNSYFGLDQFGDPAGGSSVGITLTGSTARIGGPGGAPGDAPADRNVFADNTTAVKVFTGDSNLIEGNYFGVGPDGASLAGGNFENIEIVGNGSDQPTGNVVGGAVTTTAVECDERCNVISAANGPVASGFGDGIDLRGEPGEGESPAGATTIRSNYIGLDAGGTLDRGNLGAGIDVGAADDVVIGGPITTTANFIGGNTAGGVLAGSGADGLFVVGNRIGRQASGTALVANDGVSVETAGDGGTIQNNFISGGDPAASGGVLLLGDQNAVTGNAIGVDGAFSLAGFSGPAVDVRGDGNSIGVAGQFPTGNTIRGGNPFGEGAPQPGVLISGGDDNEVVANSGPSGAAIRENSGAGVRVEPGSGTATGNLIGGETVETVNLISGNGGDAIEIVGDGSDGNVVGRNTGSSNGSAVVDLFLDLVGTDGEGNGASGPNGGIEPPAILTASTLRAVGLAETGATIRAFEWQEGDFSSLSPFAGSAVADPRGLWQVTFASTLASGDAIRTSQTTAAEGSSEYTEFTGIEDVTDAVVPVAAITSGPAGPTNDPTPTFGIADQAGSPILLVLLCAIDSGRWFPCGPPGPLTTDELADGPHTLHLTAVDEDGNLDATPAQRSFTVDTVAPETTITRGPRGKVRSKRRRKRVTFRFTSSEPGRGGFRCKIDRKPFVACNAGAFTRRLRLGKHTFRVRAFDGASNSDPTVAVRRFRIVRKRRR